MIEHFADNPGAITLGAGKAHGPAHLVGELHILDLHPHVARNMNGRRTAIDRRTARHPEYGASQRRGIREAFGWMTTVAGVRKKLRGLLKFDRAFSSATAACNLVRAPKLIKVTA